MICGGMIDFVIAHHVGPPSKVMLQLAANKLLEVKFVQGGVARRIRRDSFDGGAKTQQHYSTETVFQLTFFVVSYRQSMTRHDKT